MPMTPADNSKIVQTVSSTIAVSGGTTSIPDDATEPLNTEGTQIASVSITPKSTSNKIKVRGSLSVVAWEGTTKAAGAILAVFRGAVMVGTVRVASEPASVAGDYSESVSFCFEDSPASVAAQTYTLRIGKILGDEWYVNRTRGAANALNSTMQNSRFVVEEIRQ